MRRWLPAAVPAALALAGVIVVSLAGAAERTVYISGGVAATLLLAGGLAAVVTLAVLVSRDRTARAREEAVAAAAERAAVDRRRLLARLDHELKNPLTAIRAGLANLSAQVGEDGRREALGSVTAQAERVTRLMGDLRKLAELETRPLEIERVDVSELIGEVEAAVAQSPEAAERTLGVSVTSAPWPPSPVDGDRDLLFLALYNLAANALKFSKPGDTIELRAADDAPGVLIEVADTGAGIPREEHAIVWGELARGANATGVPGTGVGLALVRAIVERHGGETRLRSRLGQGTVVTVRLPAARGTATGSGRLETATAP